MKGHFYKRGCKCKKKKCTCGAKWAFVIDIGLDPKTGKRSQKTKSGFINREEAVTAATTLLQELNLETYVDETD